MSLFFKSNNLSLGYGNQLVINNLDLSLKISNNYEIIGKNGSGKTTLLMCISNNFIGNTFNSNIERGEYSFMEIGSSPSLIPKLSLIENIKYFLYKESVDEKSIVDLDENGIQLLFDLLNYRETQKMTSILSSQESINALSNIERTIDLND
jgi:ABC-type branched-subunit amino acid transport system ATPase component